jgi:hypothetical protein
MSSSRREPCLEPASVVAVSIYSLLLAGVLIAHVMDFPTFSTEPRAKSLITAEEPLASRDDGGARSVADGTPNGGSLQR